MLNWLLFVNKQRIVALFRVHIWMWKPKLSKLNWKFIFRILCAKHETTLKINCIQPFSFIHRSFVRLLSLLSRSVLFSSFILNSTIYIKFFFCGEKGIFEWYYLTICIILDSLFQFIIFCTESIEMKLARISIYKFFKRFREHSCRLCMECQLEPMDNKQTKKGSAEFIFCCSNISEKPSCSISLFVSVCMRFVHTCATCCENTNIHFSI